VGSDGKSGERAKLVAKIAAQKAVEDNEAETARLEREEAERQAAAKRAAATVPGSNRLATPDNPTPNGVTVPNSQATTTSDGKSIIWAEPRRISQVRYFQGTRNGLTPEMRAFRFGMWAASRMAADVPKLLSASPFYGEAQDWVKKNMTAVSSTDASGYQFLIPPEFSQDIIDLREMLGDARRLFKIEPMVSDTKRVPRRRSGLTAYWTAENNTNTESNKTWDDVELTAKDLTVISRASRQVNADTIINWGDDLAKEIAYAFSYSEDQAAFNGDGTSTYGRCVGVRQKLLLVDGTNASSPGLSQAPSGHSTWLTLTMSDFQTLVGILPKFADTPQACWVVHKAFYYGVMHRLLLALGGVEAREGAAEAPGGKARPVFLGYPVEFVQTMPSTTAVSQVCALLGDFSMGAMIGDRQAMQIDFSEHASVGGQSLWERNQIGIRGIERVDINVHDVGFASGVGDLRSANPGPIVGLETAAS
jgi:HK97 family phage major capsid protein